jgi:prevent-host-death family protein
MQSVNIHEAKTHLSRLLEQVQHGEEIIIAKAGLPIARLIVYQPARPSIVAPGAMAGEIWMSEDFDLPLDDHFDCLK